MIKEFPESTVMSRGELRSWVKREGCVKKRSFDSTVFKKKDKKGRKEGRHGVIKEKHGVIKEDHDSLG